MTTVTQSRRPEPARRAPFRLRGRTRKAVLILHILSAGVWIGVDVIVAVLVFTGWLSGDPFLKGLAYQALGTFVVWPMLVSGLVSLVTGIVLGLGSKYGLVRYWWVAVKLVLNVVLCTLILIALQPQLGDVARYGRDLAAGTASARDMSDLFFPPVVSLSALTFATILSVAKPWGRLGKRG